jgi:hypothetical protein
MVARDSVPPDAVQRSFLAGTMTDTIRTGTPPRWRSPGRAARPGRLLGAIAARGRPASGSLFEGEGSIDGEVAFPLAEAAGIEGGVASGARLCRHVELHHDGDAGAIRCAGLPGPALSLSCGAFGGSYLSLAVEVPEALATRFGPGKVLRLHLDVNASRPITAFLRLNIGSADGHEVLYETLVVHRGGRTAAFDLDGMRLPFDGRLHAWADVIFARPGNAEIAIPELRLRLVGKHEI